MNAGASETGQDFAIRNCDALFMSTRLASLESYSANVRTVRDLARQHGRELDFYTVGVITCKPTMKEAQDYYRHCIVEHADWNAVDSILAMKDITRAQPRARRCSRSSGTSRRTAWAGCRSSAIPITSPRQLAILERGGAHRHRRLVRQLRRRAALFLRRSAAAARAPAGCASDHREDDPMADGASELSLRQRNRHAGARALSRCRRGCSSMLDRGKAETSPRRSAASPPTAP